MAGPVADQCHADPALLSRRLLGALSAPALRRRKGEMVPRKGLEPSQPCGHRYLKPARLPIPPPGQVSCDEEAVSKGGLRGRQAGGRKMPASDGPFFTPLMSSCGSGGGARDDAARRVCQYRVVVHRRQTPGMSQLGPLGHQGHDAPVVHAQDQPQHQQGERLRLRVLPARVTAAMLRWHSASRR